MLVSREAVLSSAACWVSQVAEPHSMLMCMPAHLEPASEPRLRHLAPLQAVVPLDDEAVMSFCSSP